MFNQNKLPRKLPIINVLLLLITFFSCGFAYEKQVKGNYYIIGVDIKTDLSLSYKLSSGDYVGKAPGQLLHYGFNDSFLVAKTLEYKDSLPAYYIINMTKDSELAHEETFRVGPLSEEEYNHAWKQRLNLKLKAVK